MVILSYANTNGAYIKIKCVCIVEKEAWWVVSGGWWEGGGGGSVNDLKS